LSIAACAIAAQARKQLKAVSMHDFRETTFTNKIDHFDESPIFGVYQ